MSRKNPMPPGRWEEAMRRDGFLCQMARSTFPTQRRCDGRPIVHHRIVRGMGGSSDESIHDLDNLIVLCGGPTGRDGHHGEVHDNPALAYEHGLLMRRA